MTGIPTGREAIQELVTAHPEVEFALVLARTIESARTNPEQWRSAIYELARQKLQEQFTGEDASEIAGLTAALEIAIQGVEAHLKKDQRQQRLIGASDHPVPPQPARYPGRQYSTMRVLEAPPVGVSIDNGGPTPSGPPLASLSNRSEAASRKTRRFAASWRFILVMGVLLAVAATVRSGKFGTRDNGNAPVAAPQGMQGKDQTQREAAPIQGDTPKATPLLPTTFGIYAVSAGKLYELEPLRGRVPDIRVAFSTAITTPSRTILPDGNLTFIVFRRDASGSAPDQVDIRVVAKIEQAMTFDASGKPVVSKAEENWVIRNISFPYRTAPIKDNLEMYEVQSRDTNTELTPGRYALVIKGQAYDFMVAGSVTDTRQCLGRVAAANGTFYSECQKQQ